MASTSPLLLADIDADGLADACGADPGNVCRWVAEQTGSPAVAQVADWLAHVPLQIFWVLVVAFVANRLVRRWIRKVVVRLMNPEPGSSALGRWAKVPTAFRDPADLSVRAAARAETVSVVLRSLTTAIIGTLAVIYILGILGLELGPLIAGAGIAGAALGFGAQSLVRDFLSGFFMLVEDQFGVGDTVDVGEASGTVEQVTLRVTRLRDVDGTVWHVPNGEIRRVGNMSQEWARAVVDVAVSPDADLDAATEVIAAAAAAVWDAPETGEDALGAPEVLGVQYLGPDAVTIRVHGKTRPGAQWRIARLLRARIADDLRASDVSLPPATYVGPGAFTAR
ncbi:MAG: mechanosensitive ion channel family protein [Acidimicrobiales bacterium]|nr:mechanosensitive ion channel family protein [Acidimicrobiales bacterium]